MIQPVNLSAITPDHVIQSVGNIAVGNSALFLFSPRNIIDHHKRSLQYNFNNEMTDAITQHIVNHPVASGSVRKVMNTTPAIHAAIVPSSRDGIDVATSNYSNNWMFVLIIDDDAKRNMTLRNKLLVRTILIGICAQEPISHSGMVSMTPEQFLNPECQLIVTKHLEMTKYPTLGAAGYTDRVTTTKDNNIVHYHEQLWGNPNQQPSSYFTMLPGEIQNNVSIDGLHDISSVLDYGESINTKGSSKIISSMESPRQHMKTLLTAFETGAANLAYASDIGSFGDRTSLYDEPHDSFAGYVKSALAEDTALLAQTPMSVANDITTGYFTIGMAVAQYAPRVFPITTPVHSNAEIIPQHYTNISTIFSSLVCAVLPTYLNSVGLSAVAFMYNSAAEAFQVQHIEAVVNVSQIELQYKWKAFEFLLTTELFPVLFGNGGHFDLQAMCSVNSTTDVVLNFLDFEPVPIGTIYQENSVLGGIVSPLVGTGNQLSANSLQLNNLLTNVKSQIR